MARQPNVTPTVYRVWSPVLRFLAALGLTGTAVYVVLAYPQPATVSTAFDLHMNNTFLLCLLDICALVIYLSLSARLVLSARGLVYWMPLVRMRVATWADAMPPAGRDAGEESRGHAEWDEGWVAWLRAANPTASLLSKALAFAALPASVTLQWVAALARSGNLFGGLLIGGLVGAFVAVVVVIYSGTVVRFQRATIARSGPAPRWRAAMTAGESATLGPSGLLVAAVVAGGLSLNLAANLVLGAAAEHVWAGGTPVHDPVALRWSVRDRVEAWVDAALFTPSLRGLVTASGDGTVRRWQPASGATPPRLFEDRLSDDQGYPVSINYLALAADGGTLATGLPTNTVHLWRVATGRLLRTVRVGPLIPADRQDGNVRSLALSPDGATLAVGVLSNAVSLWQVATGTLRRTIRTLPSDREGEVLAVAISPNGHTLAVSSGDGTVRLWRMDTGTVLHVLQDDAGRWFDKPPVPTLVFAPDGRTLAGGARNGVVRLWDTATGALRQTIPTPGGSSDAYLYTEAPALAFAPDSRRLAIAWGSGAVGLYNIATMTILHLFHEDRGTPLAVAYMPDSGALATVFGNGEVRLWDRGDVAAAR